MNQSIHFPESNSLDVSDIECLRGFQCLFEHLSFTVSAGEGLHVEGPNGSGKTSLLRILCGLSTAESGQVSWNGTNIRQMPVEFHAQTCYLGHKPALKGELTPVENLTSFLALHGRNPARSLISETLASVGIHGHRDRASCTLSAGQQQRTALARLKLSSAPLWILDEPATALDDSGIAVLNQAMLDHLNHGGLIVFTSHQPMLESVNLKTVKLEGSLD